jgi:iron complex transport system ATP-binding protein
MSALAASRVEPEPSSEAIAAHDLTIGHVHRSLGLLRSATRGQRIIAAHITFRLQPGQSLVILGPNGAGKTTLLRTLLGLNAPLAGEVLLGSQSVRACSPRRRAQLLGYVPQAHKFDFGFRVRDLVAMGRAPHLAAFATPSRKDFELTDQALDRLGILQLGDANESELSGGERQLVLIARALVQQSQFLLLDEPTANLDFENQVRVLAHIDALVKSGLGVVMSSHSPGHAFVCGTHAAFLDRHGGFAFGTVAQMITERRLMEIYKTRISIVSLPTKGGSISVCVPDLSGL